jgi:capsule assembly protein Wzi
MMAFLSQRILIICSLFSISTMAEPWIDTSDIYLKANIQQLADAGFIITPVTTYPLMWHDILRDVNNINSSKLSQSQQQAYYYIKYQAKLAQQNLTTVKVSTAIEDSRFTSFGDSYRDKNSIQVQSTYMFNNVAAKIATSYNNSPLYGDKNRLDDSYIAAFWGNWLVSFGRQNRWFGPTWDSSFSLSNNARPMPALALTRKSAEPLTLPFTSIAIPWTVTSFMGQMDDQRRVKNALLWGFRLNIKPLKNLEIGISRLAQWGGNGRSTNLSTFKDVLIGRTNCGIDDLVCNENNPNPANQQAGYDIRYSTTLYNIPMAIYGQKLAEDGSADSFNYITKANPQFGIDAQVNLFSAPSTIFFEYGDSLADCGVRDNIGNCYYEHASYQTGMRYQGRTISNLYDNDAKSYVVAAISQLSSNTHMTTKLRYLKLNYDNSDKAPNSAIIGNPLTSVAENTFMFSSSLRHSYHNWRFTIDASLSHSNFVNNITSTTDFNAAFTVEYNL